MIELALFGLATVALITAFADIDSPQSTNPKDADSTLKALQSWTDPEEADIAKQSLGCIRSSVSKWPERWHWWNIPSTLIAAGQVVMFGIAVAPLFIEPGVPNFLLACTNNVRKCFKPYEVSTSHTDCRLQDCI